MTGVAAPIAFADDAPWPDRATLVRRSLRIGAIVAVAGGLLLSGIPLCPVALLTGQPCPGCGLTRATFACLRGDLATAIRTHPLVFFATPLVAYIAVSGAWSFLKIGRIRYSKPLSRWFVAPLMAMFFATFGLWLGRFFGLLGGPVPVTDSIFVLLYRLVS